MNTLETMALAEAMNKVNKAAALFQAAEVCAGLTAHEMSPLPVLQGKLQQGTIELHEARKWLTALQDQQEKKS